MAADFFVVPTATYRLLFVLVILAHERRRIVHVAVTDHSTAAWDEAPRYLIHDRDHAFDGTMAAMEIHQVYSLRMAKGASASGFVDTQDDQHEGNCHEHPTRMKAARHPKVPDRAIQVETSNEQASCEPCVLLEPESSGDQGESAEEPGDRAEMQKPRHEPSDRSGRALVREKERLERSAHEPLDHDAVNHCYGASDDPSQSQGGVLPRHAQ
jgi:hypothetical protein